ncbi:hypothetical protein HBB16_10995 [Pseudonocardia sp. MCCB 268]|nr:hypothetical protein [Pseudonocardia cytotoxica]
MLTGTTRRVTAEQVLAGGVAVVEWARPRPSPRLAGPLGAADRRPGCALRPVTWSNRPPAPPRNGPGPAPAAAILRP